MLFSLGNAIVLQGYILLINLTLGSTAVVLYSTTRTMVNIIKTGLGLINSSIWPELTLAYGSKNYDGMKQLHRYAVGIGFYLALFSSIILILIGKPIYLLWTDSKIGFDWLLFATFLLTLVSNTVWLTSGVVLNATNNHQRYANTYLISTIISLGVAYIIIKMTGEISLIPLSLLIIDIFLSGIVIKQSLVIVHDEFGDFFKSAISLPLQLLKVIRK